jgi:uncharacterized membrane-anchored protein YjiN (DUF445 family)
MAKKTSKSDEGSTRRRKRRAPEEIIQDLQEEIRRVRARMVARQLKQSPAHKASLSAIRSIDKALASAAEEGATTLRHALADARKSLGAYLEEQGLRLPKANLPKGPRPRTAK